MPPNEGFQLRAEEPRGRSVAACRVNPHATVRLTDSGKPIVEAVHVGVPLFLVVDRGSMERACTKSRNMTQGGAARFSVAASRTLFPLGMMRLRIYDGCMTHHTHAFATKQTPDHNLSDPVVPLVSEMLSAFLDYLRVEEQRTRTTRMRYESHLQKFISTVGDCPITAIASENLSLYLIII